MGDPINYTKPPDGLVVEELSVRDLTDEELRVFGLSRVLPVEGLLTGNKDLECGVP